VPVDPTEQFFVAAKDVAQAKRQIVLDALPCTPGIVNQFAQSASVEEGVMEWDMDKLVDLSLGGSPEEEMAQERARRRAKGFRTPSPPRPSNNIHWPSM
jgi:hypothetical protein